MSAAVGGGGGAVGGGAPGVDGRNRGGRGQRWEGGLAARCPYGLNDVQGLGLGG